MNQTFQQGIQNIDQLQASTPFTHSQAYGQQVNYGPQVAGLGIDPSWYMQLAAGQISLEQAITILPSRPELLVVIATVSPSWLLEIAVNNVDLYTQIAAVRPEILAYIVSAHPELLAQAAAVRPESLIKPLRVAPELLALVAQYNPMALVQLFTVVPELLAKASAAVPEAVSPAADVRPAGARLRSTAATRDYLAAAHHEARRSPSGRRAVPTARRRAGPHQPRGIDRCRSRA